jgi:hypothetical protein
MRKIFHREGQVGVFEELVVLIAMKVEGRGDKRLGTDRFPYPPRQFGFRPEDAAHGHRPVHTEIDPVERLLGLDLGDHLANERFIGFAGDPSRAGAGLRPQRRLDADQFDTIEFARHLHESAHIVFGIESEQRIAFGG